MKKIIFFTILTFFTYNLFAQSDNYYEAMGFTKVVINKNHIAYTVSYSEKKNGVQHPLKMNNPNVNNPYNITISSNQNSGTIFINNQEQVEDIIINFTYIYKEKDRNSTTYHFLTDNDNYSASYNSQNTSNDSLLIFYDKDSQNGITIIYNIADI
jgi:hypothetical protein